MRPLFESEFSETDLKRKDPDSTVLEVKRDINCTPRRPKSYGFDVFKYLKERVCTEVKRREQNSEK